MPFHSFNKNIVLTKTTIIQSWEAICSRYHAWHADHIHPPTSDETTPEDEDTKIYPYNEMNEWKTLSRSIPRGDIHINDIDMLGLREFDINHAWSHPEVSTTKIESASNYIDYN